MLNRTKQTLINLVVNPNARTWFILAIIIIAALAGGAPDDFGGTGS